MAPALSPNTQAILLLTAPLIAGRVGPASDLLTPGEYQRLARRLRDLQRQPADLLSPQSADVIQECLSVADAARLETLLSRGFLLSQAVERWQTRAIWVVSRADSEYPRRLKARLREEAPPILYGCGEISLLETGGLAVVGSRQVEDALIDYARSVGGLAARARRTVVSGGAKGIDQAAMRGALEAGGSVCGVLADSLELTAMNRENRNLLLVGRLVLISPYDPGAGFNVGHAMQRNKLVYALADAALVVSCDLDKGGTWAGATEQLDKLNLVPVYVRASGMSSAGLDALRGKGAMVWPEPQDIDGFNAALDAPPQQSPANAQAGLGFDAAGDAGPTLGIAEAPPALRRESAASQHTGAVVVQPVEPPPPVTTPQPDVPDARGQEDSPADVIFAAVRVAVRGLLTAPMKDAEISAALGVSTAQAKAWLERLVDEGTLQRTRKPVGYVIKPSSLFELGAARVL